MNKNEKETLRNTLEELLTARYFYALEMVEMPLGTEEYHKLFKDYDDVMSRGNEINNLMYHLGLDKDVLEVDIIACKKAQERFDDYKGKQVK